MEGRPSTGPHRRCDREGVERLVQRDRKKGSQTSHGNSSVLSIGHRAGGKRDAINHGMKPEANQDPDPTHAPRSLTQAMLTAIVPVPVPMLVPMLVPMPMLVLVARRRMPMLAPFLGALLRSPFLHCFSVACFAISNHFLRREHARRRVDESMGVRGMKGTQQQKHGDDPKQTGDAGRRS